MADEFGIDTKKHLMHVPTSASRRPHPAAAIFWGGLIAGALDLIYVVTFVSVKGLNPIVVPQAIASGIFGVASFQGGLRTAAIGVALEFLITFVATAVYYLASRRIAFLTELAVVGGLLYGIAIYFSMNFVVVPLSAAPHFQHTRLSIACDFIVHMLFIGLPMALAVRRYSASG